MVDRESLRRSEKMMYSDPHDDRARLSEQPRQYTAADLLRDSLGSSVSPRQEFPVGRTVRQLVAILLALTLAFATSARAQNFTVSGGSQAFNQQVADAAETYRRELAIHWLGKALPRWASPCPITVRPGNVGAGGATSFQFGNGEVYGWQMNMQGTPERILDSVLPHEITHAIFATHFRRAVPRWADEGACTTVEHRSERGRMENLLHEFLRTNRGIAFNEMFAMRQYPEDVLPLYSQGHSLARFLLEHAGPREFVTFLEAGLANDSRSGWSAAVAKSYGYRTLGELQTTWLDWVSKGSPASGQVVGYQPCSGGSCGNHMGGGSMMPARRQSFATGMWATINDGSERRPTLSVAPPVRPQDRVDIDELQPLPANVGPQDYAQPTQVASVTPTPVTPAEKPCDKPCPPGEPGPVGPVGPVGPTGATGAKGDKGDKGDTGPAATIDANVLAIAVKNELAKLPPIEIEIVDEHGNTVGEAKVPLGGKLRLALEEFMEVVK